MAEIGAIRFGTGLGPGFAAPDGPEALLAGLRAGAAAPMIYPPAPLAARAQQFVTLREARKADPDSAETRELRRAAGMAFRREAAGRVLQRAMSPHGFFERLAGFWADHFTVAAQGFVLTFLVASHEAEAIRPHLAGRFADLLKGAVLHPAMLAYLDQHTSVGPNSRLGRRSGRGLNENLAREVLELHSLGAGGAYTQGDVRQLAELLTGYAVDYGSGEAEFRPHWVEPGAETVLGEAYGGPRPDPGDALEFLDDLAAHPGVASHLARKLAVHFVADDPPAELVAHVEAAWLASGGALPAVYAALVEHPAAWEAPGAKIRRPQELIAAAFRASGLTAADLDPAAPPLQAAILDAAKAMNQPVLRAPGPDGWPEAATDWITPQALAARVAWAAEFGHMLAERGIEPRRFAEAALGAAMREETRFLVGAAAEKWEGIALTLAAPEFNRR